jgi:beta-barrel assembly-enhancing protease
MGEDFMYRAIFAVSLLALAAGSVSSAFAYPGDEEMGPPSYDRRYPPGYDQYPPRGGFPPEYDRYGGTFGARERAYPPPHAARPPAPNSMPHASAPDTAGSIEAARRLYAVADTVAIAGAPLCEGRLRAHTGMRTWSRDSMGPQAPQSANQERPDHSVTVFAIARNGPAARAGLRTGDKITSVNGESIPAMAGAMSIYTAKIEAALAHRGPVLLGYTREGARSVARIEPVKACDYRVVFSNSPMINAATDGNSVTIMRGLVNFLSRDEELALVVGHELGHNVLNHFQRGRALGHQAGPFNSGAQASMRQFEREADYIGLYFVALSGYDMNTAIQSSQRMAATTPMGDRGSATHPSQAERYAVLQSALREIRGKLAQGQALKPNLRTGRDAAVGERSYRGEVNSRLPVQ